MCNVFLFFPDSGFESFPPNFLSLQETATNDPGSLLSVYSSIYRCKTGKGVCLFVCSSSISFRFRAFFHQRLVRPTFGSQGCCGLKPRPAQRQAGPLLSPFPRADQTLMEKCTKTERDGRRTNKQTNTFSCFTSIDR